MIARSLVTVMAVAFSVLGSNSPAYAGDARDKPAEAPEEAGATLEGCDGDDSCIVELPGAVCADGTPMYVSVTRRPGAKNLYIYLQGGGGCWDSTTCECNADGHCAGGLARHLSRPTPESIRSGWHDPAVPGNPITADYNIVEVPYCTGDLFMGNRQQNFGTDDAPAILQQFGYHNLSLALAKVKEQFPSPERIVFMGSSAGGLGAMFNLHQLRREYPSVPVNLISDSGVPFKQPHVYERGLERIINIWGVKDNIPNDYYKLVPGSLDFGGVIKYNALRYPDHKFALIAAYDDLVMNGFSILVGTDYYLSTVSRILDDIATTERTPSQHVFYVSGRQHMFHQQPLMSTIAHSVTLGHWLQSMVSDSADWADEL